MIRDDRTMLDRLLSAIAKKSEIQVGILDKGLGKHSDDEFTVARLAEIHEFGLGVPQRSFIRGWYDARSKALTDAALGLYRSEYESTGAFESVPAKLSQAFAADCQNRVRSGWSYPDISDETKSRKESSTPLIDTGVLVASITGAAK